MPELAATSAAPWFFRWPRHTIFPERACAKDSKQSDECVPQSSIPAGSTRAGSAGLNAEQIAFEAVVESTDFGLVRNAPQDHSSESVELTSRER
jgi:hypothetical protein